MLIVHVMACIKVHVYKVQVAAPSVISVTKPKQCVHILNISTEARVGTCFCVIWKSCFSVSFTFAKSEQHALFQQIDNLGQIGALSYTLFQHWGIVNYSRPADSRP